MLYSDSCYGGKNKARMGEVELRAGVAGERLTHWDGGALIVMMGKCFEKCISLDVATKLVSMRCTELGVVIEHTALYKLVFFLRMRIYSKTMLVTII